MISLPTWTGLALLATSTTLALQTPLHDISNAKRAELLQMSQRDLHQRSGHGAIPAMGAQLGMRSESSRRMKRATKQSRALALAQAPKDVFAATPLATSAPTVYTSIAYWSHETAGAVGACLVPSDNADLVFALSTELWDDSKGVLSPLCGSPVVVTNIANNKTVTAIVGDVSSDASSILSNNAFAAIADLATGQINIRYYFPNATETPTLAALPSSGSVAAGVSAAARSSDAPSSVPATTSPLHSIQSADPVTHAPLAAIPTPSTDNGAASRAADAASSAKAQAQASAAAASKSASDAAASQAASDAAAAKAAAADASSKAAAAKPTPPPAPKFTPPPPPPASSGGGDGGQSFSGGIATFFSQNGVTGNCGTVHSDSDFVIAMDTRMYANGANCGKKIKITRTSNGKSAVGVVADSCPTCDTSTSLDLSIGLYNTLGTANEGIFAMTWQFV